MRKYPKYKKSNLLGIEDAPIQWTEKRMKHIAAKKRFAIVDGPFGTQLKAEEYTESGVALIRISDLNWGGTIETEELKYISEEKSQELLRSSITIDDIIIAKTGATIGKSVLNDKIGFGIIASSCLKISPNKKEVEPWYLNYLISSKEAQELIILMSGGSTRDTINTQPLANIKFYWPSLPEQHAIVRFLDYKTGQIDSFITNRQKQIELLKEQLRKKIYTALTKGLSNKDFKSTALAWFPEIPKNWELYKFNAAIKLLHGFQFRDNHFREHGVKVAKITQLKADGSLDLSEASFVEEKFLIQLKDKIIKSGDILMALTGGTIGKIICVEDLQEEVLQNYRVGKFIPKDKRQLKKEFMFWVLSSEFTFAQILFLQRETGQPNIGISDFSKMFFPMPDTLEEQIEITTFIVNQKSETDTLISKYQKQIDLMQEYRTSLISQAVTGKIDVREWQPKKKQTA